MQDTTVEQTELRASAHILAARNDFFSQKLNFCLGSHIIKYAGKNICIIFIRFFICSFLTAFCSVNCLLDYFPGEKIELPTCAHRSQCACICGSERAGSDVLNNTGI